MTGIDRTPRIVLRDRAAAVRRTLLSVVDESMSSLPSVAARIRSRTLLYPSDYDLYPDQWAAVAAAATSIGDQRGYLCELEGEARCFDVSFDEGADPPYEQLQSQGWTSIWETAIFSDRGTWAVVTLHLELALIGGPAPFIREIKAAIPAAGVTSAANYLRDLAAFKGVSARELFDANSLKWLAPMLQSYLGEAGFENLERRI